MRFQELRKRLTAAQAAISTALQQGQVMQLPVLVQQRQADMTTLADAVNLDPELKRWARSYLLKDREVLASAMSARDAATRRLSELRRTVAAHKSYIAEGLRA